MDLSATFIHGLISMKFLITHSLAGSFIGVGGASIKELMDMSGARVSVSSHSDLYPGTTDRVLLMTGSPSSVIFAACLVWDNFAIQVGDLPCFERLLCTLSDEELLQWMRAGDERADRGVACVATAGFCHSSQLENER